MGRKSMKSKHYLMSILLGCRQGQRRMDAYIKDLFLNSESLASF